MLRILILLALLSALTLPLALLLSGRKSRAKLPSPPWRVFIGALIPFLPPWLAKAARFLQGPVCPRCGESAPRAAASCANCGNVMTGVNYKVQPTKGQTTAA